MQFSPMFTVVGDPDQPDAVTIDGVTFRRVERLPRNIQPERDLLMLVDRTRRYADDEATFVVVTDVETWRKGKPDRYGRYDAARVTASFRFFGQERKRYPWSSWSLSCTWTGQRSYLDTDDTNLPTAVYRAVTRAA